MLETIVKLLVYGVSVWISSKYADNYWVVGAVFGSAVIWWDSKCFKNLVGYKHILFFAVSTLIYALVYYISRQSWVHGDVAEMLVGSLPVAVIVGSIGLPIAHKALLAPEIKNPQKISMVLAGSFYLVTFISFLNDRMNFVNHVNFLLISIALWQGLYLYLFYQPANKMNRTPIS